ncbi:MAG: prolipoprotein diacylglyceryl transferase [Lachnospiraceae bacterium]
MQDMMDTMDIAFPNLGIYLRNVPKSITIGNFSIALYGIVIAIGMLCGIALAAHIAKKTNQNPDTYWDISIWLIIFSIIGARVYYVIFFWDAYRDDPIQIFNLRGGGLAIYGGVIAGVITAVVYCHVKKIRPRVVLDTAAYGLILGQIIGRWANFFNREVFGGYTDNLFAMRLPIAMVRERDITADLASHIQAGTNYIQVHPTFLYESLWNLMILCIMLWYRKRKKFDGEIMLLYFGGYGLGRAWIEYIRTDQLYITGTTIPVSMVLAIVMLVASIVLDIYGRSRVKKLEQAGAARIPLWTLQIPGSESNADGQAKRRGKNPDPEDPNSFDTLEEYQKSVQENKTDETPVSTDNASAPADEKTSAPVGDTPTRTPEESEKAKSKPQNEGDAPTEVGEDPTGAADGKDQAERKSE